MFKINPDDPDEARKIKNSFLYLQGVKAKKVMNVLSSGYRKDSKSDCKQCKEECIGEIILQTDNCSCQVSTLFDEELSKGASYCKFEDEVEKLSFVFVAGDSLEETNNSSISDSRGCSIPYDSFRNSMSSSHSDIQGMVPEYLIVFKI